MPFPTALPDASLPDPETIPVLGWGIIGPGWIGQRFAQAVTARTHQRIIAAESRNIDRARHFADANGIPRAYAGAMLSDPAVEAVYIATPPAFHVDCAKAAIAAKRHVLIETPLAMSAAEARELAQLASNRGVLLVEACWTDFLPKFQILQRMLAAGAIGDITSVVADQAFALPSDHRIFDAMQSPAPLRELGTPVVNFATSLLGTPSRIEVQTVENASLSLEKMTMTLRYASGSQGVLRTTLGHQTSGGATISGSEGEITLPGPFSAPGPFTVTSRNAAARLIHDEPLIGFDGLSYQAAHFAWCIGQGLTQSPIRPLAASIAAIDTMDRIMTAVARQPPEQHRSAL